MNNQTKATGDKFRWLTKATVAAVLAVAALTAIALLAAGQTGNSRFSDVPASHPQSLDIEHSVDEGWFQGYPDGSFKPDKIITAEQVATVFGRAVGDAGMSRADVASLLSRAFNEDYKRGEWDVPRSQWNKAKETAPWAFYANKSRDECPNDVELDHMIPVQLANKAGGWRWSVEVKEQFYLLRENLHLMCGEENIKKSDDYRSANWQPNPAAAERYRTEVTKIGNEWQLDVKVLTAETAGGSPSGDTTTTTSTTTTTTSTTTTTTAAPTGSTTRADWERFKGLRRCALWLEQDKTEEELKQMVRDAKTAGFDWGRRDHDDNGYPCEGELGVGY